MSGDCLLTDPVLWVRLEDGREQGVSLPGVLALLVQDEIGAFEGLASYQRQSWYLFLCQLGAIALHQAGRAALPETAEDWKDLLAALAPAPAWQVVGDDLTQPAFLQPPLPSGSLTKYGPLADTPDGIDILVTAKDHDIKMARYGRAEPYHWVYALVNLQTMQGFLGAGNYGIARMNGGFANRPLVDYTPGPPSWGRRFSRAVKMMLARRPDILRQQETRFQTSGGKALLWLIPWEEEHSLPLTELDPYFIEICRRVRLVRSASGAVRALYRTSKAARVDAKSANGNLGDPWIPIDDKGTALTMGSGGFTYRKVADLLLNQKRYTVPHALIPLDDDPHGTMLVHFSALVRGQGRTEGLYERLLPIQAAEIVPRLLDPDQRQGLHEQALLLLDDIDKGGKRALKVGLCKMLQGGRDEINFRDQRTDVWLDRLEQKIDAIYFDHLWQVAAAYAAEDDTAITQAQHLWQKALVDLSEAVFLEALDRLPAPSGRRERARARAQQAFYGTLYKALPFCRPEVSETQQ